MPALTPDGRRLASEIAQRHGLSVEATLALLDAVRNGNGHQAQFNHPDLGGMGQWSQGGMIMIGDMFNNDLKHRIANACNELAAHLRAQPTPTHSQSQSGGGVSLFAAGAGGGTGWPVELGSPTSSGAQNDLAYAYFAGTRRLAIREGGQVRVYDTGDHQIGGVSQAQGGDRTLSFTSQHGLVRLDDLRPVSSPGEAPPSARPAPAPPASQTGGQLSGDAIFAALERLADLHKKGVLGDDEFAAKKRELLSRL